MSSNVFISKELFNCPLCKGEGVRYQAIAVVPFNKSKDEQERMLFVKCYGCEMISAYILDESQGDFTISWEPDQPNGKIGEGKCSVYSDYKIFANGKKNQNDFLLSNRMNNVYVKERISSSFNEDDNIPERYQFFFKNAKTCQANKMTIGSAAYLRRLMQQLFTDEKILVYNGASLDYMSSIKSFNQKFPGIDIKLVNSIFASYKLLSEFLQKKVISDFEEKELALYFSVVKLLFEAIYSEKEKEENYVELQSQLGKMMDTGKEKRREVKDIPSLR